MLSNSSATIFLDTHLKIGFGAGIEAYFSRSDFLAGRRKWTSTAENLKKALRDGGIACEVELEPNDFTILNIVGDSSLTAGTGVNQAEEAHEQAFEFVLPRLGTHENWREYIENIFNPLARAAIKVRVDDNCGLHVHVSVGHDKGWTLEGAKAVCIRWFEEEDEFDAMVGKERADTSWCLSNSQAKGFEGCDNNLELYIAAIKSCRTAEELTDLLCTNKDGDLCKNLETQP